jgi:hypothetical protein
MHAAKCSFSTFISAAAVLGTLIGSEAVAAAPRYATLPVGEPGPAHEAVAASMERQVKSHALPRAAVLEEQKAAVAKEPACAEAASEACVRAFARLAGVKKVVTVGMQVEGDGQLVQLQLFDTSADAFTREVAAVWVEDPAQTDALLRRVLLKSEKLSEIVADVAPSGARIAVDGVPVGTAPLAGPIAHLTPGTHRVSAEREGHLPLSLEVQTHEGARTHVALRLSEAPPETAAVEPTPSRRVLRVAVYDFNTDDIPPRVGRLVTDATVAELRKLEGLSVVGMDEIRAMLDHESQKQMVGCTDESCLAEIAGALGVDHIVIGTVAALEGQSLFGLKRIDQRNAQTVSSSNLRLDAGNGEELLAAVGPAVEETFADHPLLPGESRGVSEELALALNPPPLPTWVFFSGAAVTGGSLVASLVALSAYGFSQIDYAVTADRSVAGAIPGKELVDKGNVVVAGAVAAGVLGGVTLLLGAATGVSALFTDWRGYRDSVAGEAE